MTPNGTVATIQPSAALAIRPGQEMWTDKQRAALGVLGIKNATNADLAVFMHYCQKTGLDPFSRQIYMICRREKQGDQWVDKQTIQVGIDGFRVIRDRIAARLGVAVEYEDTVWYDADGAAHKVWLWEHAPAACAVTVIKDGKRFPGVVRTASYMATNKNGDPVSQWKTQPDHMIEKCAEAFALRRAFPHDLGGIYLEDEMPAAEQAPARPSRVTAAEITGQQPAPDVPSAAAAPPAAAEGTTTPAGLPPLPSEDEAGPTAQPQPGTASAPSSSATGEAVKPKDRGEREINPDEPGTATRSKGGGQLTALWTVLKQVFEFTEEEKDQARSVCEHILNRDLDGTTGNMSRNEARTVLDTLANWQKIAESRGDTPRAVLIAVMAEGGGDGV